MQSYSLNVRKVQRIIESIKLSLNSIFLVYYIIILSQIKYYTNKLNKGNCLSQWYSIVPLFENYKTEDITYYDI